MKRYILLLMLIMCSLPFSMAATLNRQIGSTTLAPGGMLRIDYTPAGLDTVSQVNWIVKQEYPIGWTPALTQDSLINTTFRNIGLWGKSSSPAYIQLVAPTTPGLYTFPADEWGVVQYNGVNEVTNSGAHSAFTITVSGSGACTENWQCAAWSDVTGQCGTRTCTDSNNCGTTLTKPETSKSCGNVCTENWQCGAWSNVTGQCGTKVCTDSNNCGTTIYKPITSKSCLGSGTSNDFCGTIDSWNLGIPCFAVLGIGLFFIMMIFGMIKRRRKNPY